MKRAELELSIRAATDIIKQDDVYVIGSQSILGSYTEDELPAVVTMSVEVDIAPVRDDASELVATYLDGQLGEWSEFHEEHGFTIQGVGSRTANLPKGWRDRLVRVVPSGAPNSTGLCLEPHDLCAAKLVAHREKDVLFVDALITAGLIDARLLRARVDDLDPTGVGAGTIGVARQWAKAAATRT